MELAETSYSLFSPWLLMYNFVSWLVCYIPRRGEKALVRKSPKINQTALG